MSFLKNHSYFILLFTISVFVFNCKAAKESDIDSEKSNSLNSNCVTSLNLEKHKITQENLSIIKEFISKNDCSEESTKFGLSAIEALENGTIRKVSLKCLDKYFDMNQNSPFKISFGGVFSCENL